MTTTIEPTLLNVARGIDPSADIIDVREDGDGFGVVLWQRGTLAEPEFIVHRWATKDTAGDDIKPMFYTGDYFADIGEARSEFTERRAERA